MYNKTFKVRLYPNKTQQKTILQTIGNCRFLYNQILNEKIQVYKKLKENKEELKKYKYKTEKEYKEEFEFLKLGSSRALQQARGNLDTAYQNFFKNLKKKNKNVGFPKFKSKKKSKNSYREPQVGEKSIEIDLEKNKLKLLKLGWIKFKGLDKNFKGKMKSVTIEYTKTGKFFASILVELEKNSIKIRKSNNILGIDFGLKEFVTCSNEEQITGIKNELKVIENKIKKQQKHLSRKFSTNKKNKIENSKRQEKCRLKLAKLFEYRTNFINHFHWHLANKLCNENQVISLENLNISGMIKNKKLAKSIQNSNWYSFLMKLEQKAKEYGTTIHKVNRFFPSSKLCSKCGQIKKDLKLSDRIYKCDCGLEIDRDLNASFNLKNNFLFENNLSEEYSEYKRGEEIRPKKIIYDPKGIFYEAFTNKIGKNNCL